METPGLAPCGTRVRLDLDLVEWKRVAEWKRTR
jgi:hypothetical protein